MKWQPISTAPKDGTDILGYDGYQMTTVTWFEIGKWWSLVAPGSYAEDSEWTPTHWMPLPEPPEVK